ncbi:MAG: hypothetical protein KC621_24610 [Myxococcales bacterium]|nr:hypothetical protein [Myxococcales bacterium]
MRRNLVMVLALVGCKSEVDLLQELPDVAVPNHVDIEDTEHTDAIVQVTTPRVDVLWTIDNSCSMSNEQDNLAENFPFFMDYFEGSGLDFHVGVVSTDLDNPNQNGKLQSGGSGYKYIDIDTASPITVFQMMATMGTFGSGNEKGLGASFRALEENRDTFNAGFYRDEASINNIVISDEADHTPAAIITQPEFIDWYDGLKRETDMRSFSCIVTMNGYGAGTAYMGVTNQIGGIIWDIESEDWSDVLERLGIQASGLKREYFLSQLPVESSILVNVEDVTGALLEFVPAEFDDTGAWLSGDYTYNPTRNSVSFVTYIPNALSTILITYTVESKLQGGDTVVEAQ